MKTKYFIPALILLAFSCEKKQSHLVSEKASEKDQISVPAVKTEQVEDLFPEIPFKEIPVTDSTNFDNLIEKNPLNKNLISKLGLETIERLIRSGYIKFSIKSSIIVTGKGHQREDGSIDESVIHSQPPIVGGVLGDEELKPEKNIFKALSRFNIDKKSRSKLIDKIVPAYLSTDDMKIGVDTTDFILNSY